MKAILVGLLGKIPIPSPAMVVALLALFIAASGTAVAAISFTDADGNITACADRKNGALRVLQSGQTYCTSKETQLAWKDGSTLLGKNDKAADSAKLDGAMPDAYGGVMTGRINIEGDNVGRPQYGAASGLSDAVLGEDTTSVNRSVNMTLSPGQPMVLRDFAAQVRGNEQLIGRVKIYLLIGGNNGGDPIPYHLCDIVQDQGDSCAAQGGITIPAGTPIELKVYSVITHEVLFGYRLTPT
jgi:hypothetical protein